MAETAAASSRMMNLPTACLYVRGVRRPVTNLADLFLKRNMNSHVPWKTFFGSNCMSQHWPSGYFLNGPSSDTPLGSRQPPPPVFPPPPRIRTDPGLVYSSLAGPPKRTPGDGYSTFVPFVFVYLHASISSERRPTGFCLQGDLLCPPENSRSPPIFPLCGFFAFKDCRSFSVVFMCRPVVLCRPAIYFNPCYTRRPAFFRHTLVPNVLGWLLTWRGSSVNFFLVRYFSPTWQDRPASSLFQPDGHMEIHFFLFGPRNVFPPLHAFLLHFRPPAGLHFD